MLEQFHIHEHQAVHVDPEALRRMVVSLFERAGVPPDYAALGANVLVAADLRGVDSHGVSNMLRSYIVCYNAGTINPTQTGQLSGRARPQPP